MIKYVNNQKETQLVLIGSMSETLCEVTYLINMIYNRMDGECPEAAEHFKKEITEACNNGLAFLKDSEKEEELKSLKKKKAEMEDDIIKEAIEAFANDLLKKRKKKGGDED